LSEQSLEKRFDLSFWINEFRDLGYPVAEQELDLDYLRDQKVIPKTLNVSEAKLVYRDDYIEAAIIKVESTLSRSPCARIAREWKRRRLIRPLLVFTNDIDSYCIIVPGPGIEGEARVLWLHGELYRTDREVIASLGYRGDPEKLRDAYDSEFLPYEKVREDFFSGYRDLYQKIVQAVKKVLKDEAESYAQRFLGRLMFLYFLQRKGWLKGDRHFIDRIKDYRELNQIFYESLNRPNGEEGIPFLNGSLFEREKYLTKDLEAKLYPIMNEIFSEARSFFNRYNFTVDETSPMEVEVSVDPLLLGTVLENMLPEHERGNKGTFYTPPSEIGFMCRRALAARLDIEERVEALPDGSMKFIDGLSEFMEKLKSRRSEKEVREFRDKLLSLKILDPAVGSGGFLIVMMQTILQLIKEAEESVGWRSDIEGYKRRIIPNLYGFDIEPEAVEIARLRIWLSLIVDQREPEPLPNLDVNIMTTDDSLVFPKNNSRSLGIYMDEKFKTLSEELELIKSRYLEEHRVAEKDRLRQRIKELQEELKLVKGKKMPVEETPIEFYLPTSADIIVMNPPYVRQESIPKHKKEKYVADYGLDRTSDLYAYFIVRAIKLLKDGGVASLITSDKWLEVSYGETLQNMLKLYIVAVYGQRRRSFTADVNTVITVLKKSCLENPVQFIYLEAYNGDKVRNYRSLRRTELRPGKWYYLRAPRIFEEVLLPRMKHKLGDFAEIRFGIKTGANEFFYMKDISHLYEADRLANPRKFEEWGVKARNAEELEKEGLIYIENEGGEKFVIDRKDVKPLVRSPKQVMSYKVEQANTLCLYTIKPGKHTSRYIAWGESKKFYQRPTCKGRQPWFALPEFEPAHILLPMSWRDSIYIPYGEEPLLCDARLYGLYHSDPLRIWKYLNSTLFFLTVELFCRRLGGGGGATDIKVEDYEEMPVPDLNNMRIDFDADKLLSRRPLRYFEEVKQPSRRELDMAVLKALGFKEELDRLVDELHRAFIEVVEDRLIKSDRPLAHIKEVDEEESGDLRVD
jgi:hypothetical protein